MSCSGGFMIVCSSCGRCLEDENFYLIESERRNKKCKDCVKLRNRELYESNPEYSIKRKERYLKSRENKEFIESVKVRSANHYNSIEGRAMSLYKSAKRRAGNYKDVIDFDELFILEKLKIGKCEVTGIPFDFNSPTSTVKNPYSPSIDRIDSSVGYVKENVRLVIWQYNLMKGEISDSELLKICEIIVNDSKKTP